MRGEVASDDRDVADLIGCERIDDMAEERLTRDLEHRLGHALGQRAETFTASRREQHRLSDVARHPAR